MLRRSQGTNNQIAFLAAYLVFTSLSHIQRKSIPSSSEEVSAPHVLVECVQNSACTAFTNFLCAYLDADVCINDSPPCTDEYHPEFSILSNIIDHVLTFTRADKIIVLKTTFSGVGSNAWHTHRSFTHRILWSRDPVQTYMSLSKRPFICNFCGHMSSKMRFNDELFSFAPAVHDVSSAQKVIPRAYASDYDLVVFESDLYEGNAVGTLLNLVNLSGNLRKGYHFPEVLRHLDWQESVMGGLAVDDPCVETILMKMLSNLSSPLINTIVEGECEAGWQAWLADWADGAVFMGGGEFHGNSLSRVLKIPPCSILKEVKKISPRLYQYFHPKGINDCVETNYTRSLVCSEPAAHSAVQTSFLTLPHHEQ